MIEQVFATEVRVSAQAVRAGAAAALDARLLRARPIRTQIQTQFQYRVAMYMYMLGMVAEPIIYLVVWTTIARTHGGSVDGITRRRVRRVLHRLDARPR